MVNKLFVSSKIFLAFAMLILLSISSFGQGKDDCKLMESTISIKQAVIKDSAVCMVLDSALSKLKIEKVHGYDIPYAYEFFVDSIGPNTKNIRLLVADDYERFDGNGRISAKTMLLEYKGRQIVVTPNDYSIYQLLDMGDHNVDYVLYFLRTTGEEQSICEFGKITTQEIVFSWYPNRKAGKFGFTSYKYEFFDVQHIYGK